MGYNYEVGDIVTLKKPHPCGSKEWEILRVGADFRLKCMGCGHQIMTARKLVAKKYKRFEEKGLKSGILYDIVDNRDTIFFCPFKGGIPCSHISGRGPKDQKEVQDDMNKYELAVVVSAKIEDDERAQVIEKVKALVERFGGKISDVDESGKKRLAYEIQKMKEAYYYFIHFDAEADVPGEIEQRIRIMDNVIRYLCVRQEA